MGDERVGLSRRRLLKLGAAGVALASTETMFPQLAAKAAQGPTPPITVRSSSLELTLDAENGVPLSYRLARTGIVFRGGETGAALKARMFRHSPRSFANIEVKPAMQSVAAGRADFRFKAMFEGGAPAADFTLRYALDGTTVRVKIGRAHV